ncbi:helicase-associated domain-containing protein [Actinophytocola sediminis]
MGFPSFPEHLANLDPAALTRLLAARPDMLVDPVPRGFTQLAQRLGGDHSLSLAMRTLNRDTVIVGLTCAVLGDSATVPAVVRLLDAPATVVRECLADLCDRGLMWIDGERVHLPDRLREHWAAEVGGDLPAAEMAQQVLADELRVVAAGLGVAVDGLRKPELIARISDAMADPRPLADTIAALPPDARDRLHDLCHDHFEFGFGYSEPGRDELTDLLVRAGLVLRPGRRPAVPREVATAFWLAHDRATITGRPAIAPAEPAAPGVRRASQAAAREAVRAVSTLLDQARAQPLAALKKGGVGPRERTRLGKYLSMPADELVLWIDLAHAAGLLAEVTAGYAPTDAYQDWRAAALSGQWAALVTAWQHLEHAPLNREMDGDKEHPPPLPLMSGAGVIRRALLAATGGDRSVRAAGAEIDWFCPMHGYPPAQRDEKVRAAMREAELLGVFAGDRRSELGEHLLADAEDDDLATRCAELLPEAPCEVLLQSDLTAVVSGQPSAAVSKLLASSAVPEARGTAEVWRFSEQSVRGALDVGWTAAGLLSELATVSSRAVPQPLEYLVHDAARRHGKVRVRGMRSCVVADEVLITEIASTRALAKLQLSRVAPTVLSSPFEIDHVLERLRVAGLSPMAEDSSGVVIVETRAEHEAPTTRRARTAKRPTSHTPASLAEQLVADPAAAAGSATFDLLAKVNRYLDKTELTQLADAVDHQLNILITYRDRKDGRVNLLIQPNGVFGNQLDAWCHLREADHEFAIADIETVVATG